MSLGNALSTTQTVATAVFLLIRHLVTRNILHFALKLCFFKEICFQFKNLIIIVGRQFPNWTAGSR